MDELNQKMIADGITPRKTKFETQKDFLRSSIEKAASASHTLEEFQKLLWEKYHITLKVSRGRFSYLHPDRTKAITGRSLGTHYEKEYLLSILEKNQIASYQGQAQQTPEENPDITKSQENLFSRYLSNPTSGLSLTCSNV